MLNDIAKQVSDSKDKSVRVLGVLQSLQRGISQAAKACHKADDLRDKADKATMSAESSWQQVARDAMSEGVTLSDFDAFSEVREAVRLMIITAYYGEGSTQKKLYYSDVDTLTDGQQEKREAVRVKSNNIITQFRLQWQYCIDRDGMSSQHAAKLEDWKRSNAADPEFATAMDASGKLLNPLPVWEEPSRAAATRWRNEKDERNRDTAYHAKRAIEACNVVAEFGSDPELIPLSTSEASEVQQHVEAIKAIFKRYIAKEDSES